jgi:hypothetical protein
MSNERLRISDGFDVGYSDDLDAATDILISVDSSYLAGRIPEKLSRKLSS